MGNEAHCDRLSNGKAEGLEESRVQENDTRVEF